MPTLDISLEICDTEVEMSHERFITPDGKWRTKIPVEHGWEPNLGQLTLILCNESEEPLPDNVHELKPKQEPEDLIS